MRKALRKRYQLSFWLHHILFLQNTLAELTSGLASDHQLLEPRPIERGAPPRGLVSLNYHAHPTAREATKIPGDL